MESIVLNILAKNLGDYKQKKGKNYAFHCPFCNHHKHKLEINLENGLWNCWVCHKKGFSATKLLRSTKATTADLAICRENEQYLKKRDFDILEKKTPQLQLPDEYTTFDKLPRNFITEKAVKYLLNRNLNQYEILKYKIGFCQNGKYANSVVIPSYDSNGVLNYFVTKNLNTGRYTNHNFSKNQVIFDLFINWNYESVVLVEGMFDAFAVKHNAIPLLGKLLSKQVKEKLAKSRVKKVYVCLDGDQTADSLRIVEYVQSIGREAYLVKLPEGKDPSELGYDQIWNLIKSSEKFNEDDLFRKKLQLKW
jgi:DNA primase